jgi:hypothetical protein
MQRFLIVVGLVILSFLLGYGIVYIEKRQIERSAETARAQLEADLTDAQERFRIASVANQLGVILIEVERNNFGNAKELATKAFDDLSDLSRSVRDDPTRDRLSEVLKRRDEITTDLATLNAGAAAKLQSLYVELVSAAPSETAR